MVVTTNSSSRQPRRPRVAALAIAAGCCIGGGLVGLLAAVNAPAATAQVPASPSAASEAGRKLFIRCVACHSVSAAASAKTGPHLEGIVGRRVASVPGFRYQTALKDQSFVWTKDRLERLLQQPQRQAPGLCLPFTGLTSRKDRTDLVAYLERPIP